LDALIFDFDGVVVDSEPIHLVCFQQVLRTVGVNLTSEDYFRKYLGFDDHDCFATAMIDNGKTFTPAQLDGMIARKTILVKRAYAESILPLPGAAELIRSATEAHLAVGVCSGGLREEIELAARSLGLLDCFGTIVSAEDVRRGKPDPEGYLLACRRLAEATRRKLAPGDCVVIEDAPAGIQAAKKAGMKVLAVTNSYPQEALNQADRIVASLTEVTVDSLRAC
jgi:HAD superfamily hydrolase (TIGR01509 family)